MHKLAALIPLLGWFYITLFVFFIAMAVLPKRWRRTVFMCFFLSFTCFALFLSAVSFREELQQIQIAKRSFFDRFEQKIAYQAGEYYPTYWETFRPFVHKNDMVYLLNVSTREYYYARMYLYPASTLQVSELPSDAVYAIVGEMDLKKIDMPEIIARYSGKFLIRMTRTTRTKGITE